MAIEVMNWVWNHSRAKHGARLVLLALADSMHTGHSWAWPSNKSLAEKGNMTGRAVQMAIAELVKLGELEVGVNEGPKGCNRYRVLMTTTPEKISPPKRFHPEDTAPPKDFRGSESPQADGQNPEDFSPPEDSSPPKKTTPAPENFSPGTIREPKTKISPTERSTARNGQQPLLPDGEIPPAAAKPRRGRPLKPGTDPLFGEWYAAYPVHKAPGDAEAAWAKAVREGADPHTLIDAAARYSRDPQVLRGFGKYPATWLNKKCWLDEDIPPPGPQAPPASGRQTHYSDEEYTSGWN